VSTDVDVTNSRAPTVGADELQHLVDAIVPAIKAPPGR
jgi:hypothetical protein